MVQRRLQTESALLELTLLLVAHGHVVEQLQGNELVAAAARQIYYIKDAVRLLEKQKGVVELISAEVCEGAVVQLAEDHRDFVCTEIGQTMSVLTFTELQLLVVMLIEHRVLAVRAADAPARSVNVGQRDV